MATLEIYSGSMLPEAYAHQIRSFIRLHWDDPYVDDVHAPLVPAERHPLHVVIGEGHGLFSHARVIWVPFEHGREMYRLYCLGDVFTYPAFRQRGFGAKVTAAATDLILSDHVADLAILFCDPALQAFYARHGWQAAPHLQAVAGHNGSESLSGLPMLLHLSNRARQHRPDLIGPWALPGHGW